MDWIKYPLLAVILSIIAGAYYHHETQLKEHKLLLKRALEKIASLNREVYQLSGTILTSEENNAALKKKVDKLSIAMDEIKSKKSKSLSSAESSNITVLKRDVKEMEDSMATIQENMESLQDQIIDLESLVSSADKKCEVTRREFEVVIPTMTGKINLLMHSARNWREDFNGSMVFHSLSLHSDLYLSKDDRVLSNHYFPSAKSGPGIFPFLIYTGVLGNTKITLLDDVRFKFMIWFHIKKTVKEYTLVFDVSLCSKLDFDKKFYGDNCYGMHGKRYNNMIVLSFVSKSPLDDLKYYPLSTASAGTISTMAFEIHINALKGIVTFSEYFSGRLIYAMDSVDFTFPLYPMFGLYNENLVHAQFIMM